MSTNSSSTIEAIAYGGDGNREVYKRQIIFTFNTSNPHDVALKNYINGLHASGHLHHFIRDAAAKYFRDVIQLSTHDPEHTGDSEIEQSI